MLGVFLGARLVEGVALEEGGLEGFGFGVSGGKGSGVHSEGVPVCVQEEASILKGAIQRCQWRGGEREKIYFKDFLLFLTAFCLGKGRERG